MRKTILFLLSNVAIVPLSTAGVQAEPMSLPSISAPLTGNADPFQFDAGALGIIHITCAVSGLGLWQDNPFPGDHATDFDVSNAQIFVQKNDGLFQFFVQVGD